LTSMSEPTPEEGRKKAEQEKLTREKMTAFGYDPANDAEFAKFQELEAKQAAGRIEQRDVLRGMETFRFNEDDKARRDAARPPEKNQQEQQRNSAGTDDRAAERERARAQYEQNLQNDSGREPDRGAERAAAREVWEKNLKGENRTQTIEQDPNLQRDRDIDHGR
jgi:hypothetical protein